METQERDWVWASRPSGKGFGKVEIYKKPIVKPDINLKNTIKPKKVKKINPEVLRKIEEKNIEKFKKRNAVSEHSGIYVIICEKERHVYVGQSKNVDGRLRHHKSIIKSKKIIPERTYFKIKEHYNKHGIESLEFIKILACPFANIQELINKESEIMTEYARNGYSLYNTSINMDISKESIVCPKEFHPFMRDLISKIKANLISIDQLIGCVNQLTDAKELPISTPGVYPPSSVSTYHAESTQIERQ